VVQTLAVRARPGGRGTHFTDERDSREIVWDLLRTNLRLKAFKWRASGWRS
jgi:hypothetical protein